MTFTEELTLYEDNITITLRHVGGHHADDSIIVQTSTGVLFVGDCYYPGKEDPSIDLARLESFLAYDCSVIVDGHSPPSNPDEIRGYLAQERAKGI